MPTPDENADVRRQRAEDAVKAVADGADVGEESLRMSNEFTDEWTSCILARVKRIFRR